MEPGDVQAFVDRARETIADAPAMGLRNTQLRVVEPFLSLLGWDVRSSAVEAAFETPDGHVVDYALVPADRPGALVSVVACEESLTPAGRDELLSAMQATDVDRGVYTNGREYIFVARNPEDSPAGKRAGSGSLRNEDENANETANDESAGDEAADSIDGPPSDVEQVRVTLESLPDQVDALGALSFETVAAVVGSAERRAAMSLIEADDAAVGAVTEAVADVAGEDVESEVEPLARQFLAAVVDELGPPASTPGSSEPAGEDTDDSSASSEEPGTEADSAPDASGTESDAALDAPESEVDSARNVTQSEAADAKRTQSGQASDAPDVTGRGSSGSKPAMDAGTDGGAAPQRKSPGERTSIASAGASETEYVVRFFDSGRSVGAVGNPNVDSAVQQAVEYLLGERGLGRRLQFPYTPGSDDTAFLHRVPEHPDGRAMDPVRNLGGLYLYTGDDVPTKREHVETLAERVGLRVMFSGDW